MADVETFQAGNYRFITHAFQYSGGVEALQGYAIERVRFARPLKLAEGFAAAEAHMARLGRPPSAFCACELRSPGQFTDRALSTSTAITFSSWRLGASFMTRSTRLRAPMSVPKSNPPAEPSFYAFSYTVPGGAGGFVIAGSGEAGGR